MLPVLWRNRALEDVDGMAAFIARDNPTAADRLAFNHALYRAGRRPGTRELVVHPNYILIYRVGIDSVEILRLLHARQRYP